MNEASMKSSRQRSLTNIHFSKEQHAAKIHIQMYFSLSGLNGLRVMIGFGVYNCIPEDKYVFHFAGTF